MMDLSDPRADNSCQVDTFSAVYCQYSEKVEGEHTYESIKTKPQPRVYEEVQETLSATHDTGRNIFCNKSLNRNSSIVHETLISPNRDTNSIGVCGVPPWVKLVLLTSCLVIMSCFYVSFVIIQSSNTANTYWTDTSTNVIYIGQCDSSNDYFAASWYTATPLKVIYTCAVSELISTIFLQPLQVTGHHCRDRTSCLALIVAYLNTVGTYAKFNFYIDDNSNLYGGRGWSCPFSTSELWVAVMVEGFGPNTEVGDRERILYHFNTEIATYGLQCHHYESYMTVTYLNTSIL